jgi:uncharacterized protein YebE (UPF0316 family)
MTGILLSPILGALVIFVMRVTDMSLDTLRMLMAVQGRRLPAAGIGVVQATVFIVAVSQVLKGPLTVWNVLGYALGFGTGVALGMYAEGRLALGYSMFRIYSSGHGAEIAAALRKGGFAATELLATGRDGFLVVVNCAVARRDAQRVRGILDQIDPAAFVTVDSVEPLQHGFFRK